MGRCIVFSAGTFYGLRHHPQPGDFVVAADAGYRICRRVGMVPDLVLGDFDSMPRPADLANVEVSPVEKDDTDTMLALKAGLKHGCTEFHLYGATGGKRLDHTLANLQSVVWLLRHGGTARLYGDDFVWAAVENGSFTIPKTVEWGLLSVFCTGTDAHGVTLTGVQYPLRDGTLCAGVPLGVSNHILDAEATVTVTDGTLLVGWELPPLV